MFCLPFQPVKIIVFVRMCIYTAAQAGKLCIVQALRFIECPVEDVVDAFMEDDPAGASPAFLLQASRSTRIVLARTKTGSPSTRIQQSLITRSPNREQSFESFMFRIFSRSLPARSLVLPGRVFPTLPGRRKTGCGKQPYRGCCSRYKARGFLTGDYPAAGYLCHRLPRFPQGGNPDGQDRIRHNHRPGTTV